ncbi:zinc-dependent alcohol dehydrogenase [Paenibacillus chungangensis]|uniref:Zinc-binding dehydrogenase n=1 Tax=Paenibacillus chungangensis TaxID=696535 RepID=A0ABW3HQU1_9BACL
MRGLVYEGNKILTARELPVPEIGAGEVLIRVAYTGICGSDLLIWNGGYPRVKPPVTIGHEFSGVIEAVADRNGSLKPGDRVVVEPLLTCGECFACRSGEYNLCRSLGLIGIDVNGGMAHYVKAAADKVIRIPDTVSLKDASFVEPLAVGVHMVNQAAVRAGQTVLVAGGGPIGLIAASIARLRGADVYISEINPFRIEKAKAFGFHVINPQESNVVETIRAVTDGDGAHVALEVTGTPFGLTDCIEAAGTKGTVLIAGMAKKQPMVDTYKILAKELHVVGSRVYKKEDFHEALRLIESGQFVPGPFVSRVVTLDNAVEDGFVATEAGAPVVKILVELERE